jgi:hypothetical protein
MQRFYFKNCPVSNGKYLFQTSEVFGLINIEKAVNHRDTKARSLKVREKAGMHLYLDGETKLMNS